MGLVDLTREKTRVFEKNSGRLVPIQYGDHIPWSISRVFFITSQEKEDRGNHAHIDSYQAFFCVTGSAQLICKDGISSTEFELSALGDLIIVPPGIWINILLSNDSSIAVFTNLPYDEKDYINEWDVFLKFKGLR